MCSKEKNEKFNVKTSGAGEDLVTRGGLFTSDNRGGRRRSKLKACNGRNTSSIICYHFKKDGLTRRFCLERQKKANNFHISFGYDRQSSVDRPSTSSEVTLVEGSYKSSKVIMVSTILIILIG